MRIANVTIARNYTNTLGSGLSKLSALSEKVYTAAKFTSMAEDTASGVRAFTLRRNLAKLDTDRDNVKTAMSTFEAAEKSLLQISNMSHNVQELFEEAMNPMQTTDRNIIANQLEEIRDQFLTIANGQFSDLYMFGGTNTKSDVKPFELVTTNPPKLLYNGKDVVAGAPIAETKAYIDIGLGLTLDGTTGEVNPNTAFESSISGLESFGYGEDNIILRLTEMINVLRTDGFDAEVGGKYLDNYIESANTVRTQITRLGADYSYLEFNVSRMNELEINLKSRQNDVETVDPAAAIMDFEMQQYVYNAALQMGSRILQPTLFSFLN